MSSDLSRRACLSCGSVLRPSDDRCPICGTPAGATDPDAVEATPDDRTASTASAPVALAAGDAGTCEACGHVNPSDARFCNACGSALVARPPAIASEPATRPPSAEGRRAFALLGAAVGVVALLYAVTLVSDRREAPTASSTAEAPGVGPATAIPDGPVPPLPDTSQVAADRQAALGTPAGHYESGRYYLTAAFEATGSNPEASAQWARKARAAFEASLALREDPDVRLALAEALRFDPASPPMQPITEVQRVLQTAPDHPGANYLMGDLRLMRAQFQPEWADSARASFEKVVAVAPPGSEIRARAEQALATLAAAPAAPAPGGG